MTSRERVLTSVDHREPDRMPIDLGSSIVTGIMAGALVRLRDHLGFEDRTVRIYDCFQMLGEVAMDLVERFDLDMISVEPEAITFGHLKRRDWKPWTLFDGTEVLVPGAFDVTTGPQGEWQLHEDGRKEANVVARMPKGGFYFDQLGATDWDPDFVPPSVESLRGSGWRRLDDETLAFLQENARTLRETTDKALVLTNWEQACLGPPTVGSLTDWLVLLVSNGSYVRELFHLANEIALENLGLYRQALGDSIDIIHLDGHDYGGQDSELFSPELFEELHEPCYTIQCDWIHEHTSWKTAKHCCGSIPHLIEPMIRAGIDILNPVQTSAEGMEAAWLKKTFGERITFWGGGVDTQHILPFGTAGEVYSHVAERVEMMKTGGGFIWNAIHNIQYTVPPENIVAALEAARDHGGYEK